MEKDVLEKAKELTSMVYRCGHVRKELAHQFSAKDNIVIGLCVNLGVIIPEYLRDDLADTILGFLDKKKHELEQELKALSSMESSNVKTKVAQTFKVHVHNIPVSYDLVSPGNKKRRKLQERIAKYERTLELMKEEYDKL